MKSLLSVPAQIKHDPTQDGVDHINIHFIHAQTPLGKMLSHFYELKFIHPDYGPFQSVEAFWWWYNSSDRPDNIRSLSRQLAKSRGRQLSPNRPKDFREQIKVANYHKIIQNPELYQLVMESTLPFSMYYLFGRKETDQKTVINDKDSPWLLVDLEAIRRLLKNGQELVI